MLFNGYTCCDLKTHCFLKRLISFFQMLTMLVVNMYIDNRVKYNMYTLIPAP